jgi:hypothetical protein
MERLYQNSRASKFVGKAGESHRLTLLGQDLCFSSKPLSPKDYRKTLPLDPHFGSAVEFACRIRGAADVAILFDVRNPEAMGAITTAFEREVVDKKRRAKAWFQYGPPPNDDPRFPGSKYAYAANLLETAVVALPLAKNQMKSKQRTDPYSGGAKLTTHTLTYVNVETRTLGELPRMAPDERAQVHGASAAPTYTKAAIVAAIVNGVPLVWQEIRPTQLYIALSKHFSAEHVTDLSPGSGAAAIAALMCGIKYTGFCKNQAHAKWLNQILDTAYFAVLTDGTKARDAAMSARLLHYFGPIVDEARRMQRAPARSTDVEAVADADDSDSAP